VRVRLPRIDGSDLNLFEFDYDLTFFVFFANAEERIYGRFGGRDEKDADSRMSLKGLHHAMEAALETHERLTKANELAPPKRDKPKFIRDVASGGRLGGGRGCFHCHQVNEILNADLQKSGKWSRDLVYRYPPPDNLGFVLQVDRANVVKRVEPDTPAAKIGLRAGDVVQKLGSEQVRSFADAQYAHDHAPKSGAIEIAWKRDDKEMSDKLELAEGWKKTDISWRPSLQKFVASARLYGRDLTAKEKEDLGLGAKQLAFEQEKIVHSQARDAGVQPGDIILGVENRKLEMDVTAFSHYVKGNFIRGDKITVNVLRKGEKLNLTMTLR
jgi:hypothetical protein